MDKLEYIPGDLVFHYIPKTTIKKYVKVYVCSTNNSLALEDMDGHLYDYIGVLYRGYIAKRKQIITKSKNYKTITRSCAGVAGQDNILTRVAKN